MKEGLTQLTLRQMRAQFSQPGLWAALVGVGVILALAGAFGTGGILRPFGLGLYWICVVIVTFAAGSLVSIALGQILGPRPLPLRIAVIGCAIGAVVCVILIALNTLLFGPFLEDWRAALTFCASVFASAIVVSGVLEFVSSRTAPAPAESPALLDRLPFEKRGPLVALSVEDHYVRIRTTRGEEMVLLRLADAMREAGEGGLQVHRSHWVARAQITAARREGDRAILTMSTGQEIPVSRRYVPTLKDEGLLSR